MQLVDGGGVKVQLLLENVDAVFNHFPVLVGEILPEALHEHQEMILQQGQNEFLNRCNNCGKYHGEDGVLNIALDAFEPDVADLFLVLGEHPGECGAPLRVLLQKVEAILLGRVFGRFNVRREQQVGRKAAVVERIVLLKITSGNATKFGPSSYYYV